MILSFNDVSYTYSFKPILSHANFVVNENDKWGVVGLNGAGKSTFMKLMAGVEKQDSGEIVALKKFIISYCPQTMELENGHTIYEVVLNHLDEKVEEYEIKSILNKLGFNDYNEKTDYLSGGQKKRIALAISLIRRADLYLLDEPTNHLDQDMIVWLEKYLSRMSKAVVLVTHDRYFLSRITNHIVEVSDGHLYTYIGNYADYLEQKEAREETALLQEHKRQQFLRTEIEWIRAGAQARSTKQKSRIERFNKINEMKGPKEKNTLALESASTRLGNKTIILSNISMNFENNILFSSFTYEFKRMDRVGIIGKNGCGKSTLLKIITQQLSPTYGEVIVGDTVKIGYFSQFNEVFDENERVIDYIKDYGEVVYTARYESITASQMLERFLFEKEEQYKPISKCSGGEKRRLYLCSILMSAPNILVLDEPTNDLDTETLTILEDYLENFQGCVIAVSHDRYFLDKIADRLFVFNNGSIEIKQMLYSDYLSQKENVVSTTSTKHTTSEKTKTNRLTYMEKKELEKINQDLPILENKVKQLENTLGTLSNYQEIQKIMNVLSDARKQLENTELRWFELSEKEA